MKIRPEDTGKSYYLRDRVEKWLSDKAHTLGHPAVLLGDEPNTHHNDWSDDGIWDRFRILFTSPNSYLQSVGNAALPMFYQMLNEFKPEWVTERCYFAADRNDFEILAKNKIGNSWSLESKMPWSAYNVIAISQSVAGNELHIARMIMDAGFAPKWSERKEEDPIIFRGGCNSYTGAIIKDLLDFYFIGEGEEMMIPLMEYLEDSIRAGKSKEEILLGVAQTFEFCWVPRFYEERFDESGNLLGMFRLRDDVPEKVKRAIVRDLNNCYIFDTPTPTFEIPMMSAGEVEISRGCSGKCNFCQEGYTYLPYRVRDLDPVIEALKKSQRLGGSEDVLPSAFCSSTYPWIKTLLKRTYEEVSDKVDMMSQRVDESSRDENFVYLTRATGTRTVSLGVEGNSQRMRNAVNKNCSYDEFITAFRFYVESGYQSIKLFLIANLPGETKEDTLEIVELGRGMRKVLDEYLETHPDAKAPKVTFSWTPLCIQGWTPFQWAECPVQQKSLMDVFAPLKEMGFKLRVGGSSTSLDTEYFIQLIHRGDSRLQDLYIEAAKRGMNYFITVTKGFKDLAESYFLKMGITTGWDYWFSARPDDTVFPWDYIDIGTKKSFLLKRWHESQKADPTNYPKCVDKCEGCGVCSKEDLDHFKMINAATDPDVVIEELNPIWQTGNVQRMILKIETDERHRFVDADHWRYAVRRAFFMGDLPVSKKSVKLSSAAVKYREWTYGVDYVSVNLVDQLSHVGREKVLEILNENAVNFKFLDLRFYPYSGATLKLTAEWTLYEIEIDRDIHAARARINEILASESWVIKLRSDGFGGMVREDVDVRRFIKDMWFVQRGARYYLRMILSGPISPYDVYQRAFNLKWAVAGKHAAHKVEMFMDVPEDLDDIFRPRCVDCGQHIEVNVFDEPVDMDLCFKCQDIENGELI